MWDFPVERLLALSGLQPRRRAGPAGVEPFQPHLPRAPLPPALGASVCFVLLACADLEGGGGRVGGGGVGDGGGGGAVASPRSSWLLTQLSRSGAAAEGLSGSGRAARSEGCPASELHGPLQAALIHLSPPTACSQARRAQLRAGEGITPWIP